MENYKKVVKNQEENKAEDNEIRLRAKGDIRSYLGYAHYIFDEKKLDSVVIKASGDAIVKAVILTELIKRSVGNLHQINKIFSTDIVDEFEPKVEGLDIIKQSRKLTSWETILTKGEPSEDEKKNGGY